MCAYWGSLILLHQSKIAGHSYTRPTTGVRENHTWRRYNIVVFPALSSLVKQNASLLAAKTRYEGTHPTIRMRTSFSLPHEAKEERELNIEDMVTPMGDI
jgi:hypothetical protein